MAVELPKNVRYDYCKTTDVLRARLDSETVKNLAMIMVANLAEFNVYMVCDMSSEYPTKHDVEAVFSNLNTQAAEQVDEVFDDLKAIVKQQLANMTVSAKVRQLNYDAYGKLNDIRVVIDTK